MLFIRIDGTLWLCDCGSQTSDEAPADDLSMRHCNFWCSLNMGEDSVKFAARTLMTVWSRLSSPVSLSDEKLESIDTRRMSVRGECPIAIRAHQTEREMMITG